MKSTTIEQRNLLLPKQLQWFALFSLLVFFKGICAKVLVLLFLPFTIKKNNKKLIAFFFVSLALCFILLFSARGGRNSTRNKLYVK